MVTQIELLGRDGGFNYLGVEEHWFCSAKEGLEIVDEFKVGITAARKNSIIIWVDDEGQHHGLLKFDSNEVSRLSYANKNDLQMWLEKWLPKIHIDLTSPEKSEEILES